MDPSDASGDDRVISAFEKHDEFVELLTAFLAVDLLAEPSPAEQLAEDRTLTKLTAILDEYQEAAYLLDPYLEELVGRPIESVRSYASHVFQTGSLGPTTRLEMLAKLIYWYTKTRGYKTIVRYFPHETADFAIALGLLTRLLETVIQWEVTYVLLLWISLICMLPFDLTLFDEKGKTPVATTLEIIGLNQLSKAGKERDAAAVLLSKLYIRKDVADRTGIFFTWGSRTVQAADDVYSSLGFLQVISELLKGGTHAALSGYLPDIRELLEQIKAEPILMKNTLIRKYCSKISGRLAVMQLPQRSAPKTVRSIRMETGAQNHEGEAEELDEDVPETLDEHIEELVTFLQDKDTVVRYSAAKGLARISERLPSEFANQVLETILSLYAQYEEAVQAEDYVPDAEGVWQGTTLACAEFARRGLVRGEQLSSVLDWTSKALLFDIRKGAVSVGSNVRDAAAYVMWASARSQTVEPMRPWALPLAQRLVSVSVFDREITIRRAASAAFQENVGRLGLFPHGIDVLKKIDFYAVSIRRHAFEIAAPEVAEHKEYRDTLLNHLETVTLRHWDPQMRVLAANACRRICELDLASLGPALAARQERLLPNPDSSVVHGALLALANVAESMGQTSDPELQSARLQVFRSILKIPIRRLQSFRGEQLLGAVCAVLGASISHAALDLHSMGPPWLEILEIGMKSRDELVQDAAAAAWSSTSSVLNCKQYVERWAKEFLTTTPSNQRGIAKVFGKLKYASVAPCVGIVTECLSAAVTGGDSRFNSTIEVRRDCFIALRLILCQDGVIIGSDDRIEIFRVFLRVIHEGLRDYTTDQRGDVGSWIRLEALKALGTVLARIFQTCTELRVPLHWLASDQIHQLLAVLLKQGVERLDTVRDKAGLQLAAILSAHSHNAAATATWKIEAEEALTELCNDEEGRTWKEGSWFFPKVVRLLLIPTYRTCLLEGLVFGIGSKTESTLGPAGKALSDFAAELPISKTDEYTFSLNQLGRDLLSLAKRDANNNSHFIPYLQTFLVLLQADVLQTLVEDENGKAFLQELVSLAGRNASRIKNVQRIIVSMNIITSAAPNPAITPMALEPLLVFLTHPIPRVRAETAESLYLVAQTSELLGENEDRGEELLLETPWLNGHESELKPAAEQIVQLIREGVE
ncbi:ARM repeat-containing protein [Calocera cornea HHB12733]|uniref:ARM repeat-containing protein n=1 Tax=Calocera cornea HHB12733 TaxID=1353952 RepID=A0A165IAF9_9BASI|nr:ARM repeat-containing protein [Calocera cornea HHB12733]